MQREQGLETGSKPNVAPRFLISTVNVQNEGFSVEHLYVYMEKNTFGNTFI